MPIFKRRIFTRKVSYRLFQLNVGTFQKCKNAHTCALRDCLGVSRPFVSDKSLKCIDREGLERCRTGTRQHKHKHRSFQGKITFEQKCTLVCQTWMATLLNWLARKKLPQNHSLSLYHCNLEGMIQSFHKSHAKKPESGPLSDWIGKNMDDLRCSDWPKCRHPLVVVDFSLHLCLHNEQWTHASSLWNFGRLSFLE